MNGWIWLSFGCMLIVPLLVASFLVGMHVYLRLYYLHILVRIFQEKPLFIVPRGQPIETAEDVSFPTTDGLTLRGCYLASLRPRRGVILFGLEFGSNRWSCLPSCNYLLEAGFDIFAFESRNQGDSDCHPGYEPLHWLTEYEVKDARAAIAYLKRRADADPRGIGFFGISKGAGAGLFAAATDPYIRCCATDGVFATYTTLVPYMRQWYRIYNSHYFMQGILPPWYYGILGMVGMSRIEDERKCRFVHLERVIHRLAPRPLLMIHGGADPYIKPEMSRALFERAGQPKEHWLVEGAKHNLAQHVAGDEYRRRVRDFFETHLATVPAAKESGRGGRDSWDGDSDQTAARSDSTSLQRTGSKR